MKLTRIWPCFALIGLALASAGDRSGEFQSCTSTCSFTECSSSNPPVLPLSLRLTRWTCMDDCKYRCMHWITNERIVRGMPILQYHGKWPFWRFLGMQEPASVVFSAANFYAQFRGLAKIRKGVPRGHPMRGYWIGMTFVSMNAWVWSAVFHTRDLPITEKLDYFSAGLTILYGLYLAVIRLFHLYPSSPRQSLTLSNTANSSSERNNTRFIWTSICTLAYLSHISYLGLSSRFDYQYNIIANSIIGIMHNLLWLLYALPVAVFSRYPGKPKSYRPTFAYKAAAFALLTTLATGLELFDFSPIARSIDAHSLWHLSTAPIALFWYGFLVQDAREESWRYQRG